LLLFDHNLHRVAHVAALHPFDGHDLRRAICAKQIDFGVPVSEHMDMGRRVVIDEDDEAQAMGAVDGNRAKI
jgi:hypothetical protein